MATPNARNNVSQSEMLRFLARHCNGNWGVLGEEDKQANEEALTNGSLILSCYETDSGLVFWIITDPDRSVTTILLPEDH